MTWQPVETAPKHKSIILCCWWAQRPESPLVSEGYRDWDGSWRFASGGEISGHFLPPTHWMPLPEPPHTDSKGGAE